MDPIKNLEWLSWYVADLLYRKYATAVGDFTVISEDERERKQREATRDVMKLIPMCENIQKTLFTMKVETGTLPMNCSSEKSALALPEKTDPYILKVIDVDTRKELEEMVATTIGVNDASDSNAARPAKASGSKSG